MIPRTLQTQQTKQNDREHILKRVLIASSDLCHLGSSKTSQRVALAFVLFLWIKMTQVGQVIRKTKVAAQSQLYRYLKITHAAHGP